MYLVEIKASARRHNGAVGDLLNREGARHEFEDRAAADAWARSLADDGEHTVWVQDAPPHAEGLVDGYLMSRGEVRAAEAPFESEQRELSAVERRS